VSVRDTLLHIMSSSRHNSALAAAAAAAAESARTIFSDMQDGVIRDYERARVVRACVGECFGAEPFRDALVALASSSDNTCLQLKAMRALACLVCISPSAQRAVATEAVRDAAVACFDRAGSADERCEILEMIAYLATGSEHGKRVYSTVPVRSILVAALTSGDNMVLSG
jgi:hypothetical protein